MCQYVHIRASVCYSMRLYLCLYHVVSVCIQLYHPVSVIANTGCRAPLAQTPTYGTGTRGSRIECIMLGVLRFGSRKHSVCCALLGAQGQQVRWLHGCKTALQHVGARSIPRHNDPQPCERMDALQPCKARQSRHWDARLGME